MVPNILICVAAPSISAFKLCSGHQATSLLLGREGPQATAGDRSGQPASPAPTPPSTAPPWGVPFSLQPGVGGGQLVNDPTTSVPPPAPTRKHPSLPVSSLLSSTGVRDILQDQNQGGSESRQVTEVAASAERRAVGGGTGQGGGSVAKLRPTPDGAGQE